MEIIIKQIGLNQLTDLQKISRITFFETFKDSNSDADMQHYLETSFSDERLSAELNNPESLFFLAYSSEKVAGYLKLNFGDSQSEKQEGSTLEIERIYVAAEFQGKKVGQLLFAKALEIAQSQKFEAIWLGVWEENKKAIAFYEKNGFSVFGSHEFKLGDDIQTDILMKLINLTAR